MSYWLYILRSQQKEIYYIGITNDPARRCFFHNTDSRSYTRRHRPWSIVYQLQFDTKADALAAERKVKSWKSKKMFKITACPINHRACLASENDIMKAQKSSQIK
ncbi:MAG: GIY-YIG nuclease family protein [Balneolaceae bacterium]